MRNDFVALILSHGRSKNVRTYKTLRSQGYTGEIRILVDNEDEHLADYRKNFCDELIVFDKTEAKKDCDLGDNFEGRGTPLFARNQCHKIVKQLGFRYFIELDDDYSSFSFKFDGNLRYKERKISDLDSVLMALVSFLEHTPTDCICMAQGGDFIGGAEGRFGRSVFLSRKIMNTFICDVERPFKFYGRFNDDVNAYVVGDMQGKRFFTFNMACVHQEKTQKSTGGLTESYRKYGTYVKSFYTVMFAPTCAFVKDMGCTDRRIHHAIKYDTCAPKILAEKWRKV